ncbi:MAG: Gfo/Idh/MocA family oxidoreductase [Planctomycetota bacterium]
MKIGVVGFDTSHAYVFPARLRELSEKNSRYKDLKFVAGWPGDPATAVHPEMLGDARKQIVDELKIKPVDDLDELIEQSDAFMIESVNGDTHLELAKKILPARKPTYIDKPFANTFDDAQAISELAEKYGTPCWSTSSLRYEPTMLEAKGKVGETSGIDVYGPAPYFEKGRGIVYYGVHTAEIIITVMGVGLKSVRTSNWHEDREIIVAEWNDGRMATLRGRRKPAQGFGGVIHGSECSAYFPGTGDFYGALCKNLAEFFVTKKPPVPIAETVEVIKLLDAAVRSREADGKEILV